MTPKESENIFGTETAVAPLGIIAMNGTEDLASRIDHYLTTWAAASGTPVDTFLLEADCPRFSSGDAKGIIHQPVRGLDLYILVDVANYNCTYKMFGLENHMSPDDHYQDVKRIIQAVSGKAHRLNVIMPVLYGGRQHRRNYRESLDCAVALQELQSMGVSNIITVDAHDPKVVNAVPLMGIDNIMPVYQTLKTIFRTVPDVEFDKEHFMVVSPDEGAINRNMYYASVLGVDLGMFYKRRDYSRVVNGRNPIIAHEYLGNSVEGKDVFIADDMISSGESMLDLVYELKNRKANRIYAYVTYGFFTGGFDRFDKAYEEGVLSAVYATNLTYRAPELLSKEWFHEVDVSKYISYYIASLNHDLSISKVIDPHEKIKLLLEKMDERHK